MGVGDRVILERLRAETQKAMADPATVEKLNPQGMEPMPLSPAEFDALVKKEVAENITLVKAAGIILAMHQRPVCLLPGVDAASDMAGAGKAGVLRGLYRHRRALAERA